MESEKVKEIKEKLKERYCYLDQAYSDHLAYGGKGDEQTAEEIYLLRDTIEYINELESENEELKKYRCDWLNSEKMHLQADMEDTEFELASSNRLFEIVSKENQTLKDRIALLEKENETLRNANVVYETVDYCAEDLRKAQDRIAELEKGSEALSFAIKQGFNDCQTKTLKQFAERLKERLYKFQTWEVPYDEWCKGNVVCGEIDEILKEFIEK